MSEVLDPPAGSTTLPGPVLSAAEVAALPPPERAEIALKSFDTAAKFRAAVQKHKGITVIKDKAGRDQAHGAAMELMRLRTGLKNEGDAVREDAAAFAKAVPVVVARLAAIVQPEEDRLKALRDAWDKAEKERKEEAERLERLRKTAIAERISDIKAHRALAKDARTSAMVQSLIDALVSRWQGYDVPALFEEFADDATVAYSVTVEAMRTTLQEKQQAEAEAERQRLAREAVEAEAKRQAEAAAKLAAEREAFEKERAAFAEQQRLAAEKAAWEAKWGGLHPNGAPMYSRTTFKDNGEPIQLNDDGTRSIFCDLLDGDEPAVESMVDLGDTAHVSVDSGEPASADVEAVDPFDIAPAMQTTAPAWVGVDLARGPDVAFEWKAPAPGVTVSHDAQADALAILANAPVATKKAPEPETPEAPTAEEIADAVAKAFNVSRTTAADWLCMRADEFFALPE